MSTSTRPFGLGLLRHAVIPPTRRLFLALAVACSGLSCGSTGEGVAATGRELRELGEDAQQLGSDLEQLGDLGGQQPPQGDPIPLPTPEADGMLVQGLLALGVPAALAVAAVAGLRFWRRSRGPK